MSDVSESPACACRLVCGFDEAAGDTGASAEDEISRARQLVAGNDVPDSYGDPGAGNGVARRTAQPDATRRWHPVVPLISLSEPTGT
jgi:hypothetical protein